jgi:hypothetical protein
MPYLLFEVSLIILCVLISRVIATIDERTKVVHSASITIFPFKPRDFVTVVHCRQLRDGTRLVLNR